MGVDERMARGNEHERFASLVPELDVLEVEKSIAFYTSYGFAVLYARPAERFAYLRRGSAELMLQDAGGAGRRWRTAPLDRPFGRGLNLQIAVDDVDVLWAGALDAGHLVVAPLEDHEYQGASTIYRVRQFVVADPDGYLLRFSQDLSNGRAEASGTPRG
jgi:catechol 2,3-dioxygenase-like lactoylglutathione lyase family enzyme